MNPWTITTAGMLLSLGLFMAAHYAIAEPEPAQTHVFALTCYDSAGNQRYDGHQTSPPVVERPGVVRLSDGTRLFGFQCYGRWVPVGTRY